MRHDSARPLQRVQDPFEGDLGSMPPAAQGIASPTLVGALEVRQIAGEHAGGWFALSQGSFQLGPGEASSSLEAGSSPAPQFGLAVAPDGTTQLIPPPEGLTVDGRRLSSPTTLEPGQIIDAGSARFQIGVARDRDSLQAEANDQLSKPALPPMPASTKKRGVDPDVMNWLHGVQAEMARSMRSGFTPDEIKRRSIIGPSMFRIADPGSQLFGRAPVAIGDLPLTLPGDVSSLNKQTREAIASVGVVPSVQLDVDLLTQSVAIVGNHRAGQAVASWLALCITAMASPDHVGLTVLARNSRGDWSWCDALPHSEQRPGRPMNLIINDRQPDLGSLPSSGVISIVDEYDEIPAGTEIVLDLSGHATSLQDTSTGRTIEAATPIGVSSVFAYDVTFAMAEHFLPPAGVQR